MDKKKILIHGADVRGKKLARRIDHIFQIEGFIERDGRMQTSVEKMFPCYSDISEYPGGIGFEPIPFKVWLTDYPSKYCYSMG